MTFYDKYPQLKQKQYLLELIAKSVYATMALEDQIVPMKDIEQMVLKLIEETELKDNKFIIN